MTFDGPCAREHINLYSTYILNKIQSDTTKFLSSQTFCSVWSQVGLDDQRSFPTYSVLSDVKAGGSLGFSDHKTVQFRAGKEETGQQARL